MSIASFPLFDQYTTLTELNSSIVNELIERIEIHQPDKSSGKQSNKLIYFIPLLANSIKNQTGFLSGYNIPFW